MNKLNSLIFTVIVPCLLISSELLAKTAKSNVTSIHNEQNNYSFFIITDHLSPEEVKEKANQAASRLACDKGFSSYVILSEKKVQVIVGKTDWPNSAEFPQNLYEEAIVQRNLSNERTNPSPSSDYSLHDAYLYKIKLLETTK